MLQWTLDTEYTTSSSSGKTVSFKIEGIKLHGFEGETLFNAIVRALAFSKTSRDLAFLFRDNGFLELETKLQDGTVVTGTLKHFHVEEGRQFEAITTPEDYEIAQDSSNSGRAHVRQYFKIFWQQLKNNKHQTKTSTPLATEKLQVDIAIIGGGVWGRSLADILSEQGKKIALFHQGELATQNNETLHSFGQSCVLDVENTGTVYALQRQGYQSAKLLQVQAVSVVFATGSYESRFRIDAGKKLTHLSLSCFEKLVAVGLKPQGRLIASVGFEAAFKRVLALQDQGVKFDLLSDLRSKAAIKNIDLALSHSLRVSTDTIPLDVSEMEAGAQLKMVGTHDTDDKFSKNYAADGLISARGVEPYGSLFWRAGGNYCPAFPNESHVIATATRLETGVWLLPVGALAGVSSCNPEELHACAQEITELCDNKRRRKNRLGEVVSLDEENYSHLLLPVRTEARNLKKACEAFLENDPLELLHLKLYKPSTLNEAPASSKQRCGAYDAVGINLGARFNVNLDVANSIEPQNAKTETNPVYRTIKGKKVLYKSNKSVEGVTFANVAGVLLPERFEGDIVLLATQNSIEDSLRGYFLRPENLAKNGKSGMMLFRIKDKRNVRAVRKEMQKDTIPCIGFGEMAAHALEKNEMYFFQMFADHVFGLKRRKLSRYTIGPSGALPEVGDVLYANAHAKKQLGIVLHAQKTGEAGLVVYPIGANLPASLYHRRINQVYIHQEI